jgi:hypothetical protein
MALSVNLDGIPNDLKALSRWMLWRYDPVKNTSGEFAKVPYRANGKRARANDERTWSDFRTIVKAYERGGWEGIGIALGDGLVGVDLDNVRAEDGTLTLFAHGILDGATTYHEVSPSESGVKVFAFCDLEGGKDTGAEAIEGGYALEIYKGVDTTTPYPRDFPAWPDRGSDADRWEREHRAYGRWFAVTGHGNGLGVTEDAPLVQRAVDALTAARSAKGERTRRANTLRTATGNIANAPSGARHNALKSGAVALTATLKAQGIDDATIAGMIAAMGETNGLPADEAADVAGWAVETIPADAPLPPLVAPTVKAKKPVSAHPTTLADFRAAFAAPESAAKIHDDNPPRPRIFMADIFQAGLALVVGSPGVGKTPLLIQLAVAFSTGGNWLGTMPCPKVKTLYIGVEYDRSYVNDVLNESCGGRPPEELDILTLETFTSPATEEDAHEMLLFYFEVLGYEVIIIDTLSGFLPVEKFKQDRYRGDYREFLAYHRLSLKGQRSLIGAWHDTKTVLSIDKAFNGSQGLWGSAGGGRVNIYRDEAEDVRLRAQLRGKARKEWALAEAWIGKAHIWATVDGEPEPVFGSDVQRKIYRIVKDHGTYAEPLQPKAVMALYNTEHQDTPVKDHYCRRVLGILRQRGLVTEMQSGYVVKRADHAKRDDDRDDRRDRSDRDDRRDRNDRSDHEYTEVPEYGVSDHSDHDSDPGNDRTAPDCDAVNGLPITPITPITHVVGDHDDRTPAQQAAAMRARLEAARRAAEGGAS